MESKKRIAVIGGGAAGLMAAGRAAELSFGDGYTEITLFEKNDGLGKKLLITGKGRCNLTNNCDTNAFLENVPRNPRFLYSSLAEFSPQDTMDFFESLGVPLKTERGRRVFPESDKSADIVNALKKYCANGGVKIINRKVTGIDCGTDSAVVHTRDRAHAFDRVIIATGGCSYPLTGSDGDGYRFAKGLGIKVTALSPSLVPLVTSEAYVKELMGLSLRNVSVKAHDTSGRLCYEDFGELLFTHYGISGPTVLSMSAHLPDITPGKYTVSIDLKPALDEKTLDKRIVSDLEKFRNRNIDNALSALLPAKMIPVFLRLVGIAPTTKSNLITREQRADMVRLLKSFTLTVSRTRPISEAIITSGGIDTSEINPRTMQVKKYPPLYFAGEVIDVDAYTGGYNLQIAFSTARLAARSVIYS